RCSRCQTKPGIARKNLALFGRSCASGAVGSTVTPVGSSPWIATRPEETQLRKDTNDELRSSARSAPRWLHPAPGYPSGGQPAAQPPKNYLWMNILGILGCTVIGIIGLVFSLQVNKKWEMGDYAGAESASSTAKILGIIGVIGFAIGIVMLLLSIIFTVMLGAEIGRASC